MKKILSIIIMSAMIVSCGQSRKWTCDIDSTISHKGTDVFQADWENIAENYTVPEWFRDAKFGIFIHWGIYSVPAYGNEWYAREMYQKDSRLYNYHVKTFGDHTEFGYKDFIPMFKAEKFSADEWADLFVEAGARYVVPVAEHHDGFAMYDSDLNPWNATRMGPKRDVIMEMKTALEKRGLVFGVSSHKLENAWFFNGGMKFPSDVQDTTISLYGHRVDDQKYTEEMAREWLRHTYELVDKYQPQLFWFDWTVNNPVVMPYFNRFLAYYYNNAIDWGKGVVANAKQGYPTNVLVWDMERGKSDKMMVFPWQTDTSVGKHSWSYVVDEENKTPSQIIHDFVDIVSKNGNLLLNIGPKSDGTVSDEQKEVLLEIGRWLKVNGEAIYGTRCWKKFGEGLTEDTKGTFTDHIATKFTSQDIRFTTKGNDFYAIVLEWGDKVKIRSLSKDVIGDSKIMGISLLGSDEKIEWEQHDDGLQISFPSARPCGHAYAFRISFDKMVGADLPSEASNEVMRHG
jgi:alpha-L-fucosidase